MALGLVLHLPTPPARRIVMLLVTRQASGEIRGSIEVERVESLSVRGVELRGVTIRDPQGQVVLASPRLVARANLAGLLWDALWDTGALEVRVTWARADHVDVFTRLDPQGRLTLEHTFAAPVRPVPAVPRPKAPAKPSRAVVLAMPAIEVGSVRLAGELPGVGPIGAEASAVRGALNVGPAGASIDSHKFPVTIRQVLPEPLQANGEFHWRTPSSLWVQFVASYRDMLLSGGVRVDGDYLEASVDVPRTQGAVAAQLVPGLRLYEPFDVRMRAAGKLPKLQVTTQVALGAGRAEGQGDLQLSPELRAQLGVRVRELDLRAFEPDAPPTKLGADTQLTLAMVEGKPRVTITGTTHPTEIEGIWVPSADATVVVDPPRVTGTALVHEPGIPTELTFALTEQGALKLRTTSHIDSLWDAPRIGGVLHGRAVANVDATFEDGRLDASVDVQGHQLARGAIRLGDSHIVGQATGKLPDLTFEAQASGSDLGLGPLRWGRMSMQARGPLKSPRLAVQLRDADRPEVQASARLSLKQQVEVQQLDVRLAHAGERVQATSDGVVIRDGAVELRDLDIEGLGAKMQAAFRVSGSSMQVKVAGKGVSLTKLSRVTGLDGHALGGDADVLVSLDARDDQATGCVQLDVRKGRVDFVDGLEASVHAQFAGTHVDVEANASLGAARQSAPVAATSGCLPARPVATNGLVDVSVSANVALHGPLVDASSWKRATGTARLTNLTANLDKVGTFLGAVRRVMPELNVPQVGGIVRVNGEVVRSDADKPLAWTLAVGTQALQFGLGAERTVRGADLFGYASMTSDGQMVTSMCVRNDQGAFDSTACDISDQNVLVSLNAQANVPYQQMLEGAPLKQSLLEGTTIDARLSVLDRPLSVLAAPVPLREPLPVTARMAGGTVRMRGQLLDPSIEFEASVLEMGNASGGWRFPGLVCARGGYNGARATVQAHALRSRSSVPFLPLSELCGGWGQSSGALESLGYVNGDMDVEWSSVLEADSIEAIPWIANANLVVSDLELSAIPPLADHDISGRVSLAGGIRNLGVDPEFGLQVRINSLRTEAGKSFDEGTLLVRTDERGLAGTLDVYDVAEGKRETRLRASLNTEQVRWVNATVPSFDSDKPVNVEFDANRFRVGLLGPLLQPALSYLDGALSGKVRATWDPAGVQSAVHECELTLEDGAFQVPVIGQQFLDVSAHASAIGPREIVVDAFRARSLSGALAASARIQLEGLEPKYLAADINTDRRNRLRLTFEGVPVGDLYGRVLVFVNRTAERNDAEIELHDVHVDLTEADLRAVQSLDSHPDVVVVPNLEAMRELEKQRRGGGSTSLAAPSQSTPWRLTVRTATPATVSRTGMQFSVVTPEDAEEGPVLLLPASGAEPVQLRGYLLLTDGRIEVTGKKFLIEPGQARLIFTGDPGEPSINVTARWDAPDGTRVWAEVTGPLKNPRVQFRSDPAKPANELLVMILFGTSPSDQTLVGGEGASAAGMGGGVAAAGLNMLIQGVSPIEISTRLDTSQTHNLRPTVVVEVAPNVTAEATVNTGEIPLGQNPDRYMLTLDWRFLREWSVRTTVGNQGSSVFDLIWQHRY